MLSDITDHYTHTGNLTGKIRAALEKNGVDMSALEEAQLSAVDEFHIRGRQATLELASQLHISPDWQVLDIGSGLGGPARTLAVKYGCHVTGVDLTPAYVEAANTLSSWIHRKHQAHFVQGDATDLSFSDHQFDAAITFHTAMNIPGKTKMYSEAHRVLKPGGRFLIYDVMRGKGPAPALPAPWAQDQSQSYLETPDSIERMLVEAGFSIDTVEDSSRDSLAWFEATQRATEGTAPPILSIQTIMGPDFPKMVANQLTNLREDRIRTVAMFCTA